ncbi:MAG: hypothetical protein FWF72_07490 [Paludibacter sp.]|nr:hypothetical protein [Paludibacter sp.]
MVYNVDLLYHLSDQLAAGLTYDASVLFGVKSSNEGISDIGMYGLALYGVKGYYKFLDSKVSPFATLSLGLSQLSTPDVTYGDNRTVKGITKSSIGIKPEIGVQFGKFVIAASYFVPMKYKFTNVSQSAGVLEISAGVRIPITFGN